MIFETTYTNKEIIKEIDNLVGKPFSFLDSLKMGGIGSKRMPISDISEEFKEYLNAGHYITYANIELRPQGILLHFRHKLESFCWPMPFSLLKIEMESTLTLINDGKFISFKDGLTVNNAFIQKLKKLMSQGI